MWIPLTLRLLNSSVQGTHETGHARAPTRNSITFCVRSSLSSTSTHTKADLRAILHANHLQIQPPQWADEIMER